jgi:broad specificity phosphatase PhoE
MARRGGPEILLVRHGETELTLPDRHTGVTDIPPTDDGHAHARLLGERLAGPPSAEACRPVQDLERVHGAYACRGLDLPAAGL